MKMSLDQKALILVLVVMAGLVIYRAISYWVTGFFVSDEFGYYYDAVHGTVYGDRWFFGLFNIAVFRLFAIRTVDGFAFVLPFYLYFWASLTILAFYKTLRVMGFSDRTIALSLFSSLFVVSFSLLSLGFLTDPVGLSLAMLGIYTLVRFTHTSQWGAKLFLSYAVPSLLFFVAAAETREPYSIFLVAWLLAIVIASLNRVSGGGTSRRRVRNGALVLLALSAGVTVFVLQSLPNSLLPQVWNMGVGLVHDIFPALVPNVGAGAINVDLGNALGIFFGGLALGWGPPLFVVGFVGLTILLLRTTRTKDSSLLVVLLITTLALLSYLVVAILFSSNLTYFSFSNYSSIIRFSDTALPAYFLAAPFVLSRVEKKMSYIVAVIGILVLFAALTVPIYQVYSTSELTYVTANPFNLTYRTPAAQVLDYFVANPSNGVSHIIGVPYGWYFTPGRDRVAYPEAYSLTALHTLSPTINYSEFVRMRWTTFYIYTSTDARQVASQAPWLLPFIQSSEPGTGGNSALPFKILSSEIIIRDSTSLFIEVQLSWS